MMNVDTLAIARELKAAELPAAQAEAIAAAIGRSVSEASVTKADLDLSSRELKADIDSARQDLNLLRQEFKADLERLRGQLLVWFIGTQVAVGGLIVALIKM